jgi:AraC-like DNA-binding protein/beta-xylosidase
MTLVYAAAEHQTDSLQIAYLYRVLDCLTEHFQIQGNDGSEGKAAGSDGDAYMADIMQYILENYHGDISLTALADQIFVSASTLSRAFKKKTGMYFGDYLLQLRVKEAITLLLDTNDSMTKIALSTGFSGSSSFSRAFRKVMGMTPVEYREEARKDRAENAEMRFLEEQEIRDELFSSGRKSEDGSIYRLITTDLGNETYELHKKWCESINIGEVYDLTRADVREHCLYLRDHLHFKYVRIWNVFSKNTKITDGRTSGRYNFRTLDQALDFLTENGMKPFLDFGRRPSMAMGSDGNQVFFEETYTLFENKALWEEAIREVLRHISRKYGKEEVSSWYFELSRNSLQGEEGERCYGEDHFDFFEAWWSAFNIVRREVPGALFGGVSAVIGRDMDFLNGFYQKCAAHRCVPDFCSFSIFPYANVYSWDGSRSPVSMGRENPVQTQLDQIKRVMEFSGVGSSKLFITEINNTIANRDYLNDSCFRAAFLVSEMTLAAKQTDLLCVMAGSDWISDYLDSSSVIHGGIGLLTKDMIRKPAYYAMEFLNMLGSRVLSQSENHILTINGNNDYYLLCMNYVPFGKQQYPVETGSEPDLTIINLENEPSRVLSFRLSGVPEEGYYCIKRRSLSPASGSIADEWAKFQFAEDMTASDVRYLRERCIPEISMQRKYVSQSRELSFEVEMKAENIMLLHIYPA